jgi:hypothetical protein
MRHYGENQYEAALALFDVLENDQDSLPVKERTQYFHYRGMTHFRLNMRHDARHWLGLAAASDKLNPGALSPEEKERNDATLAQLNKERYEFADLGPSTGRPCTSPTDCDTGQSCVAGSCKAAEGAATPSEKPAEPATPAAPPCADDKDCPAEKTCTDGKCVYR